MPHRRPVVLSEHHHSHAQIAAESLQSQRSHRALKLALAITAAFTAVELVGGFLTGSLALLADAVHMFSDNAALSLAIFATWLAQRPSTPQRSFGYRRAEILAALANGAALVAIAIWIFIEAGQRLTDPPEVDGSWMLVVAAVGLLANLASAAILWRSGSSSLNVRAALRHVIGDLLGSVGTIVAALLIVTAGWREADPIVGLAVGVLILFSSFSILRESLNVLLESTPANLDASEIGESMVAVAGVREVHDLHIWTITSGFAALSAHVLVGHSEDCHGRRRDLEDLLRTRFGITHTTLQVDHEGGEELIDIERAT